MSRCIVALTASAVVALALAGCGADGTGAAPTDRAHKNTAQKDTGVFGMPDISSCKSLEPVLGQFVEGLPFDAEESHVDPKEISCAWGDKETTNFDDIQSFGISIYPGDIDMTSYETFVKKGEAGYSAPSKLAALDGVMVWLDGDTAVVGAAAGSVLLPGLEIGFSDGRYGADNLLQKDDAVDIALQIVGRT